MGIAGNMSRILQGGSGSPPAGPVSVVTGDATFVAGSPGHLSVVPFPGETWDLIRPGVGYTLTLFINGSDWGTWVVTETLPVSYYSWGIALDNQEVQLSAFDNASADRTIEFQAIEGAPVTVDWPEV